MGDHFLKANWCNFSARILNFVLLQAADISVYNIVAVVFNDNNNDSGKYYLEF